MSMITILVVGGGVALALMIIGIVVSTTGDRTLVDDRLNKYLDEEQKNEGKEASKEVVDANGRNIDTVLGNCLKCHV